MASHTLLKPYNPLLSSSPKPSLKIRQKRFLLTPKATLFSQKETVLQEFHQQRALKVNTRQLLF